MKSLFPCTNTSGLELLKSFLQFNSASRMTAEDAVFHHFFCKIKEQGYIKDDTVEFLQDREDCGSTDSSQSSNTTICAQPLNVAVEHECESEKNIRLKVRLTMYFFAFHH